MYPIPLFWIKCTFFFCTKIESQYNMKIYFLLSEFTVFFTDTHTRTYNTQIFKINLQMFTLANQVIK